MLQKWKEKLIEYEKDRLQVIDIEYKDKKKELIMQQKFDISFHKSNRFKISNILNMPLSKYDNSKKLNKIINQNYKRKDREIFIYRRPDDKVSAVTLFPTPLSKLKTNSNGKYLLNIFVSII